MSRSFDTGRGATPMMHHLISSHPTTPEHPRPRTHERTTGIPQILDDLEANEFADVVDVIAEDPHLTQCAQVWSTCKEDDQAEQHDHGTIDEVPGDPYMERGEDTPEEADREVDLLEQILLLGQPESRPCTFNHEVGIDVFEIMDSVSTRSSTLDAVCMELHTFEYGLKESPNAVLHHSIQVRKRMSATGHIGLAGPDLFDTTEECTTEAYSVQSSSRTV